jgi:plastocyanin
MRLVLAIVVATMVVGASSAQVQSPAPRTIRVDISGHRYNHGHPVTIRVGDRVIWVNNDNMAHSASLYTDPASNIFDGFNTGFIQPGAESEPILFLKATDPAGVEYACDVHDDPTAPMKGKLIVQGTTTPDHAHHEAPSIHSMLVNGPDPNQLFMHHYSLFNNSNHTYHVTVEARLDEQADRDTYVKWLEANRADPKRAVIDLGAFLLADIKPGGRHNSFIAKFWEDPAVPGAAVGQWGSVIPGLAAVRMTVVRLIQFRAYDPDARYQDRLTYQLYGNTQEAYLAHEVTEAPSFQQVVKLKGPLPSFLTADLIRSAPLVTFPTKSIARSPSRYMKTGVLSNGTHLLLAPPINTLNPEAPLLPGEEVDVLIGDDPTPRKLTIEKSIWEEFRILNR